MKHSHRPQNACRVKRCGSILKFQVNKSHQHLLLPSQFQVHPPPMHLITHTAADQHSHLHHSSVCVRETQSSVSAGIGCSAGTQTAPRSTYFGRYEIPFNHVLTLISRFCCTFGLLVTWKLFKGHGFEFHRRPHTDSVCCRKSFSPFRYWSHSISPTTVVSKNTKVTSWNVKMSTKIVAGKLATKQTVTAGLWKRTHMFSARKKQQSSAAYHWPK